MTDAAKVAVESVGLGELNGITVQIGDKLVLVAVEGPMGPVWALEEFYPGQRPEETQGSES